jgi:hypothetical protein
MITAKEARKATEERLRVLAKEFVLNKVDPHIRKAIDKGRSDTVVDLTNSDFSIPNLEFVGPEIVKLLNELGFDADFYICDGYRYEANITVKWGDK